jgi:hypothetical protein
VKVWDLKTGKVAATLKGPKKLLVRVGTPLLAWLADGKTLVLRQGTSLEIWDTAKGEHTDAFSLTGLPVELPPGPGSLPPTGGSKEANTSKEIEQQSVLSADGSRLAVQMVRVNLTANPPKMESEVVVWDVPARRRLGAVRLNVSAERLKTMANVLQLNRNSQNFRYSGYHHYEVAIALSPNGTRLAVGDSLDANIQVEPVGPVRVYEVANLPAIASAKPADGAGATPLGAAAVRDEFKRATAAARAKLLARFDEVINRWEKIAASGMPGAAETVARLKEEKARFEAHGLAPWSEPMRAHLAEYMAAVGAARAKIQASYKGTELPAELRDLLDKSSVLARWKHQPGNGAIALYSNGRLVDPASPHTWSYKDGVLTFRWKDAKAPGGYWVDTCHVAADGLSYAGANQIKTQVTGTLVKDG